MSGKRLRADALSVRLGGGAAGGVRADYLSSGAASTRKTVSAMAARHDAGRGRRTVAAFNGDFFDIDETGAPLGPAVDHGRMPHSPALGTSASAGFGPAAAGRVLDLYFAGTLTLPGGTERLDGRDAANVPANGIGAYDSGWGTADRALAVDQDPAATEVTVRGGRITAVSGRPGKGPVPRGATVLLGRDAGARTLARLHPGDRVSLAYHARTGDGSRMPRTAIGGRGLLVVDGVAQNWEGRPNNEAAPRTAVGFSKDGSTLHVLTVDGRQAASDGVTLTELARMMRTLGAYNALNLDGGGSSTLLAREPGARSLRLENSPSDGAEREVPNGLALTAPRGSGRLTGFFVHTSTDPEQAPSEATAPGGHPERVFPGLTRKVTAAGHDETYGPAAGVPRWHTERAVVGTVSGHGLHGVFRAHRSGRTRVIARRGAARGAARLTVLGALDRIRPTDDRVALADSTSTGRFGLVGYDRRGTGAPVEAADARLDYDRSLFDIRPDPGAGDGGFTVKARPGHSAASGVVTVRVGGHATRLAVSVGLHDRRVASFDDAADWTFSAAQAEGALTPEPSGHDGPGLRMTYDFSGATGTRAAYANPPQEIPVPGRPRAFTLWVNSDGKGAWPSLHLKDADGADLVLRGAHLDAPGWRKVTFEVPEHAAYPLRVHRFYLAETRPTEQYAGTVVLDELVARTPPDVPLPDAGRR